MGAKKRQNKIWEYQEMFHAWRKAKVMTFAGYILGFPTDTPESIARDIEIIKKELPVDILEFFYLTPLPGSEDHKILHHEGRPDRSRHEQIRSRTCLHRAPDHVEGDLGSRSIASAWTRYYSDEHVETIMRRAAATGLNKTKVIDAHHAVLRRVADRGRASAAIRFRAPQDQDAAPLRHADRQSADLLSVARV